MAKTFRLFFSQGQDFTSKIVRWFIRSKYLSHTVGNFKIFEADIIMESSDKGVDFAPASYFIQHNSVEAVVRPISGALSTEEGLETHLTWLINNYGNASYDWLAAGSIGIFSRIKWLWQMVGWWLKRHLSKKAVQCTELWVRLLQHAGYVAVSGVNPDMVDPLQLLKYLALSSDFVVEKISPGLQKELGKT